MATNFPASLDTLTNPTSSDSLSSPSHSAQHANVNDAIEALQAKVGADSSAVTTSLDYKVADHASRLTTLEGAAGSGLVLVSRTTIGTAVSSISISNCFSADYDSYLVIIQGGASSTNNVLQGAIGGTTSPYRWAGWYSEYTNAVLVAQKGSSVSYFPMAKGTSDGLFGRVVINSPFQTKMKTYISEYASILSSGDSSYIAGYGPDATSDTDLIINVNTGTVTGGTIDIYGYVKA